MANYQNLKAAISAAIKTNGNQEITGQVLQDVLKSMVSVIGANYTFAGVATPSTNPSTPDQNVVYMASQAGTYTNFGGIELPAGISLLMWNGAWTAQTFFVLDDVPTAGSNNLVKSGGVFEDINLIRHIEGNWYDAKTQVASEYCIMRTFPGIKYVPIGGSSFFRVTFWDYNLNQLLESETGYSPDIPYSSVEVPYNNKITYIRFHRLASYPVEIGVENVGDSFVKYINGISQGNIRVGEYYDRNGLIKYHGSLAHTDLIPISPSYNIYISATKSGGNYDDVVFFDANKVYISGYSSNYTIHALSVPSSLIPANAAFFAVNTDPLVTCAIFINGNLYNNNAVAGDICTRKKSCQHGKKLITIGDSLTENCIWQHKLVDDLGVMWSRVETLDGYGYVNLSNGQYTVEDKSSDANYRKAYRMAWGGHGTRALYTNAKDAKHYSPDIITIYLGQNDVLSTWITTGNTGTTPYEIVENEIAYHGDSPNTVSVIAAYKGLVEMLMNDCPKAIIYLVTQMRVFAKVGMADQTGNIRFETQNDVIDWEFSERYPKVEYIRAIGKLYGLPVIDLWDNSGITDYNSSNWYGEPAYDCTQVHPTTNGYRRMAEVMETLM